MSQQNKSFHRSIALLIMMLVPVQAWAQTADSKPNIVLVLMDNFGYGEIGVYGGGVLRGAPTPNIDSLAAGGTRYTRVFTTAGVCAPSRAALLTGQHQISFGAQHMRTSTSPLGKYYAQPDTQTRAFPELLRAHGGYFTYTDNKLDYQFSGIYAGSGPFTIWDRDGADDYAWRERAPRQPFFGMINFQETHESGVMRATGHTHSRAHKITQQRRKAAGLVAPQVTNPKDVALPPYYPDLPEVRADLARHYDNIAHMDARVGRILQALEDDGLRDDTIIIWTTDHGDGLPRAKRELYDAGLHVPLILNRPHKPAGLPATDGRLVSFVDIAPTILSLAQIDVPPYMSGTSILSSQRRYIYASRDRLDEVTDRQRAVRDKRFKYIRSWHPELPGGHTLSYRDNLDMVRAMRAGWAQGALDEHQQRWFEGAGAEQLYDTDSDPHELTNLTGQAQYQGTLDRLRGALDAFLQRVGDTSERAEKEMRAAMLNEGAIPVTPAPLIQLDGNTLTLSSPIGASIGYRYQGDTHWRLYTEPVSARALTAKSVRYGWRESEETTYP